MYCLSLTCAADDSELISAELWDLGAAGVQEEDLSGFRIRLKAWFEQPSGLVEQFQGYSPQLQAEPDIDWEARTREAWPAFELGERLYLAPVWDSTPTPMGRMRLTVHPGLALGTGAHPATQLCLESLDRHLQPGSAVVDIGTGSAILVSAAALLGARLAVGCDVGYESTLAARANLLADGVPPLVFAGSTRAIPSRSFDFAVANINALTHRTLASEYARICRRALILSGFLERESEGVATALKKHGWNVIESHSKEEWICLVLSSVEIS